MTCVNEVEIVGLVYDDSPAWDGGARSIISFDGDGWFGWEVAESVVGAVVGLNTNDANYHYSDIQHGFHFRRGDFRIIEDGVWKGSWIPFSTGDRFYVFRSGGDVLYIHCTETDGTFFTTDPRYPGLLLPDEILDVREDASFGTVFLDASLYKISDYVYNEDGGEVWLPDPTAGNNLPGNEAIFRGSLPFAGVAAGSDTGSGFNGAAYGELSFELTASGSTPEGLFAGPGRTGGLLPFVLRAGDTLRGWVRGELPFAGGLGNGSAGSDGLQDVANGGAMRGYFVFDLAAAGVPGSVKGLTNGQLPFIAGGFGSTTNTFQGIMVGEFAFDFFGYSLMQTGSYLNILLPEFGVQATVYDEELSATLRAITDVATTFEIVESLTSSVQIASPIQAYYAFALRETVQTQTQLRQFTQQAVQIAEAVNATDATKLRLLISLSEEILAAAPLQTKDAVKLIEQVYASSAVSTFYQAVALVYGAIALADARISTFAFTVTDAAEISEEARFVVKALSLITDVVNLEVSTEHLLTILVEVSDTAEVEASTELTAQYLAQLIDSAQVYALLKTPAELSQGWVMNTEGSLPISEYDNYVFNSLAYSPEYMIGTNDTGVYELTGDTDAGENITAELTSMMLDFATSRQKRVRSAYLGYTSSGELVLKVKAVEAGELVEHWYKGRKTTAQTPPGENLLHIGQGLKSRYWQFELTNIDGADFEIDQLELYPIILGRRV